MSDRPDDTTADPAHDVPRAPVSLTAAEALARRFHELYERLAPDHGYETRRESAVPWADVPAANRGLMIAVSAQLLADQAPQVHQALQADPTADQALVILSAGQADAAAIRVLQSVVSAAHVVARRQRRGGNGTRTPTDLLAHALAGSPTAQVTQADQAGPGAGHR